MSGKKSKLSILINGIIRENPVLVLVLGTCPTLAVTTSVTAAIGMGIAATVVLICSNVVISALRNVIPDKVRIPCYIVLIAGFVTIVQLVMQAYLYSLYQMLGVYLSLIVVNCIILGRAEMFARNNTVGASFLDALGMGIGFTAALFIMGCIREFLGAGAIFGVDVYSTVIDPVLIFILPPGGFFVFGVLIAIVNKISAKKGLPVPEGTGCSACPCRSTCAQAKLENEKMEITPDGCTMKEVDGQ